MGRSGLSLAGPFSRRRLRCRSGAPAGDLGRPATILGASERRVRASHAGGTPHDDATVSHGSTTSGSGVKVVRRPGSRRVAEALGRELTSSGSAPADGWPTSGAGTGYFTVPLAKAVGASEMVYAIDIGAPQFGEAPRRARPLRGLPQVVPVLRLPTTKAGGSFFGGSRVRSATPGITSMTAWIYLKDVGTGTRPGRAGSPSWTFRKAIFRLVPPRGTSSAAKLGGRASQRGDGSSFRRIGELPYQYLSGVRARAALTRRRRESAFKAGRGRDAKAGCSGNRRVDRGKAGYIGWGMTSALTGTGPSTGFPCCARREVVPSTAGPVAWPPSAPGSKNRRADILVLGPQPARSAFFRKRRRVPDALVGIRAPDEPPEQRRSPRARKGEKQPLAA